MKTTILIILTLASLEAIAWEQIWVSRFNLANSEDISKDITIDANYVYVTGWAYNGSNYDFKTIKYDIGGGQQWIATYNGPGNGNDYGRSIAVDASGNVYVSGESDGNGTGPDYATIKYNWDGTQLWVARYSYQSYYWDAALAMTIDNSGNVYVTGWSSASAPPMGISTIKYNTNGVLQWVQRYTGIGWYNIGFDIGVDASGNVYVTGQASSQPNNNSDFDIPIIKYDASGNQQWVYRYNGPASEDDKGYSLAVGTNSVYVTGMSQNDYVTLRLNFLGVQQWVQTYNGPGNGHDQASVIKVELGSGHCYVTGKSQGNGTGYDFATLKYAYFNGNQLDLRRFNGSGNSDDMATGLDLEPSGTMIVTGQSISASTLPSDPSDVPIIDYATVRHTYWGVDEIIGIYDGPGGGFDIPSSVVTNGFGYVFVTGQSWGTGTGYDYATILYRLLDDKPQFDKNTVSIGNFPNPFNPVTQIRYDIPKSGFVVLKVYNVLGSEVAVLVYKELKPGTYEVEWDAANYTSGVYFYKLSVGDYTETKKMILLK